MTLRAGAAVREITPPPGLEMGGYGAREGVAQGTHDPLHARAVVWDDGATRLGLVSCDLVGVSRGLTRLVRETASEVVPPEHLVVCATHTHSGPSFGRARVDEHAKDLAREAAAAVGEAASRLEDVRLLCGEAELDTVSQNRRDPEGPIESRLRVLVAEGEDGVVATLVAYACHPTVLEYDNLLYSADFVGPALRTVEEAFGGVAIFVQGATGDVNPVWRRHDFREVERVGRIVGAAAARTVGEVLPAGTGQWAVNLSWSEETPKAAPGTVLDDVVLAAGSTTVELPHRPLPRIEEIDAEIRDLEGELDGAGDEVRRRLRPRLNAARMERTIREHGAGDPRNAERLEVQVLSFGPRCALVALPGEFLVSTARRLERDGELEGLLFCGYANGYAGYLPPPDELPFEGYEVGIARFVPEAEERVRLAAAELTRALRPEGKVR